MVNLIDGYFSIKGGALARAVGRVDHTFPNPKNEVKYSPTARLESLKLALHERKELREYAK